MKETHELCKSALDRTQKGTILPAKTEIPFPLPLPPPGGPLEDNQG